jgi:hypothetical protein
MGGDGMSAIMRKAGNWYVKSIGIWHFAGSLTKAIAMSQRPMACEDTQKMERRQINE